MFQNFKLAFVSYVCFIMEILCLLLAFVNFAVCFNIDSSEPRFLQPRASNSQSPSFFGYDLMLATDRNENNK